MLHTGCKTSLVTQLLDSLLTTNDVRALMTACLELCLTLAQTTSVDWCILEEFSTLSSLGLDVVTGMGRDDAGKANQSGE